MRICSLCGAAMQNDEQFCTSCGAKNEMAVEAAAPKAVVAAVGSPEKETEQAAPALDNLAEAVKDTAREVDHAALGAIPGADTTESGSAGALGAAQAASDFEAQSGTSAQPAPQAAPAANSFYGTAAQPQNAQPYRQPMYTTAAQGTQQGVYAPVMQQNYVESEPVTLGEWMLNYLIMIVPIANIVMLCIWAFGNSTKLSQRNWARASLIWMGISIVLMIVFFVFVMVIAFSSVGPLYYN